MNPGLYQEIESLMCRKRQYDAIHANLEAEPPVRHTAAYDSAAATRQMKATMEAALENRLLVVKLQGILDELHDSNHSSRHRALVITALETAQDRLTRELGPEEEMGDRGSEMGEEEI